MKKWYLVLVLTLISFRGICQNYFNEYPITAIVASGNGLFRIECSTYDSSLQTTVYFESPWVSQNILISSVAFGKAGFTYWTSPVDQYPLVSFIIYDYEMHAFSMKTIPVSLTANKKANVKCGLIWVTVALEYPNTSWYYYEYSNYRYNMSLHKWGKNISSWYENISNIWNFTPFGNTDVIRDEVDEYMFYYDPVSDSMHFSGLQCTPTTQNFQDDYLARDTDCQDDFDFKTYDAEIHSYAIHPRRRLTGIHDRGVFNATDSDSSNKHFFFIYDQAIHQWVTDSVNSYFLNSKIIADRIIAYSDSTVGYSRKIFYLVFDPQLHQWVKDSSAIAGNATGLSIINGTVRWNDSNGLNIRGFDINSGWGNYNTIPFMYFHMTDFSSQNFPMIHVRNYSIGSENSFFDFGDGVVSADNRHVLWHSYRTSGTYNVCNYDSLSSQNWCQPVTMNICSSGSIISFSEDSLCLGDSVTISLNASVTGTVQWQRKNGAVWLNETAPGSDSTSYGFAPLVTAQYRALITNGNCLPVITNEQLIKVSNPGLDVADTLIRKCSNITAKLALVNPDPTALFQWQGNSGTAWNNMFNGTGTTYNANSTINMLYRVIVNNGGCGIDTSGIITVLRDTLTSVPETVTDTICGPGIVNLSATSNGNNHWYLGTQLNEIIHVGNNYSPFINTPTSFYVRSTLAPFDSAGYISNAIGTTTILDTENKGMRMQCNGPSILESLKVYPLQTGIVRFKLYKAVTGELVNNYYHNVVAGAGAFQVFLNIYLQGNTIYDLVVDTISVPLEVNSFGVTFPVINPSGSFTILGYIDSIFHTSPDFYNYYDIVITAGCKSNSAEIEAISHPIFNNGDINPASSLVFCQGDSVKLNAWPGGMLYYQWLRNGITVATSGVSYIAKTPGAYQVIITNTNLCSDTTLPEIVRVPCIQTFDPGEKNEIEFLEPGFLSYYKYLENQLAVSLLLLQDEKFAVSIIDQSGRTVFNSNEKFVKGRNDFKIDANHLATGIYLLKMEGSLNQFTQRWMKY